MTSPAARILIIEDDKDVSQLLQYQLEQIGYEVILAANGVDGLRLLQQEHPHLVVLDVMMPRMDGWETLKRIRQYSDVPTIMLTALAQQSDQERGLALGADDYVTKPFSLVELAVRVREALQRGRQPLTAYR